jgi:chromosome segregation ATPase
LSEQLLKEILKEMQALGKTVGKIETDQQSMKTDIRSMKTDIQHMKDEQQLIKQALLETHDAVDRIEVAQKQQQRVIDLLSARSIDHEAARKQQQSAIDILSARSNDHEAKLKKII